MVINLLGTSLQEFMNGTSSLSLTLTLKIGIKILLILKTIHDKGLVHRDIKPDNFLFGLYQLKDIYLIDFGFCKSYLNNEEHVKIKKTKSIIGSKNYASIMCHKCFELSRRDDLESFCYMLFYFYKGSLPWDNEQNENVIINLKNELANDDTYPIVLLNLLKYVRCIEFEEKPNYFLIIDNFKREIEILSKNI